MEKIREGKREKILVTGSCGMLGAYLVSELYSDYDIIALDIRRSPFHAAWPVEYIECDITDRKRTGQRINGAKPDLVIHAAAWTDVDGCEGDPDRANKVNGEGTGNVVASLKESSVPIIYISTDFVFDGKKRRSYTEDDVVGPLSVYGRSKVEGEKRVAALKRYAIVRTSWLYGANGKNFVDAILKRAETEREFKVVDDQTGCPTYAKDLAKAIKIFIKSPWQPGIYNISNSGRVSWFGYAKEIIRSAGIDGVAISPISAAALGRPAKRPEFSVLDNGKFEHITGFVMRSWQIALKEYLGSTI
ncbi:MAG: dTDP-4-dehydrorhamnose reductase [Candidatus Omnitrophota bacterium]